MFTSVRNCFLECSWYFSRMRLYMFYIVVKFQTPRFNTFWDMNFFLVTDGQTDRRKVMHMSPPCMSTGGLKNYFQVPSPGKKILTLCVGFFFQIYWPIPSPPIINERSLRFPTCTSGNWNSILHVVALLLMYNEVMSKSDTCQLVRGYTNLI